MMFKKFKQKRFIKQLTKQMQQKCWFQEIQVRKQDLIVREAIRRANNLAGLIERFKDSKDKGETQEKNDNIQKKKLADARVETESNTMEAVNKQLMETEADLAETLRFLNEEL